MKGTPRLCASRVETRTRYFATKTTKRYGGFLSTTSKASRFVGRPHSVFRPTLFWREITALRLSSTCTYFRDSCRTAGVEETPRRREGNGPLVVEQSHKLALHRTQIADLLALDHCPVFTPAVLRYEFPSHLIFIIMAALRSRCGHHIFAMWFLSVFFPRLISAVADWMSTILLHIVWP